MAGRSTVRIPVGSRDVPLLLILYRGLLPAVKRLELEADHSHPSGPEIKNE